MSSITSFFSSFISTVHNDDEEKQEDASAPPPADNTEESESESEPEAKEAEEEEEEEPEDVCYLSYSCRHLTRIHIQINPSIREDCQTTKCAKVAEHFEHCQEKVQAGEGFKGEDCVEELCVFGSSCFLPFRTDCMLSAAVRV